MKKTLAPPTRLAAAGGTGPLLCSALLGSTELGSTLAAFTSRFVSVTCSTAVTSWPHRRRQGLGADHSAVKVGWFDTIWLLLLVAATADTA